MRQVGRWIRIAHAARIAPAGSFRPVDPVSGRTGNWLPGHSTSEATRHRRASDRLDYPDCPDLGNDDAVSPVRLVETQARAVPVMRSISARSSADDPERWVGVTGRRRPAPRDKKGLRQGDVTITQSNSISRPSGVWLIGNMAEGTKPRSANALSAIM